MKKKADKKHQNKSKKAATPTSPVTERFQQKQMESFLGEDAEIEVDSHSSDACDICKNKKKFRLHSSLLNEFRNANVAIFAGAGISTENREVIAYSLYEDICSVTKLNPKFSNFPDAMEIFATQPNGRLRLVEKIKDRLDYVDSFPDLQREATRFHKELATLYAVDTVVTTNWDTYFERFCAAQPFVIPSDFAFWGASDRKVLKVHGSIANFGTLIATRTDYNNNSAELSGGMLGSFLKTLLSTKTIVFFGYSARDEDFNQIWESVRSALGPFGRQHYIVTIEEDEVELKRFRELGLIPICTDATYFLHAIKEKMQCDESHIPDDMYDEVALLLQEASEAFDKVYEKHNIFDDPEIILCASYQDGLVDACERIVNLRPSGKYSNRERVHGVVHGYTLWMDEKLNKKKYADVAYIQGYLNAMLFVTAFGKKDTWPPPIYFLFGKEQAEYFDSVEDFSKTLKTMRRSKQHHVGALKEAIKATTKLDRKEKIFFHHKCQLM